MKVSSHTNHSRLCHIFRCMMNHCSLTGLCIFLFGTKVNSGKPDIMVIISAPSLALSSSVVILQLSRYYFTTQMQDSDP